MEYIVGIEEAFKKYIGLDSVEKLKNSINQKPMILIAGDQLTGKSTQAKKLAENFNGTFHSVGNLFREVAAKRGITVAEQARLLLTERGIDVSEVPIGLSCCPRHIHGSDLLPHHRHSYLSRHK